MANNLPLSNLRTLDEIVSASTASRRFTLVLLSAFAAFALALSLVGIFGVTSYSVSRQTEIVCGSPSAPVTIGYWGSSSCRA